MSRATTIEEVLDQLDGIIEDAIRTNDRLGLFAYIYRRTTAEIQKEIQLKSFENNERLEKMDVVFANLYLDAYSNYKDNKKISRSWDFAFKNKNESLTILQHILMGMSTHINLDLAIATSQTMNGTELSEIENDFNKVNDVLFNIINELQERLGKVSPLLFLLDWAGKNSDERIIDFSMRKAREQAWNGSNLLWALGNDGQSEAIMALDSLVLKVNKVIKRPKSRVIGFVLKTIARFEQKNIGAIISKLREP